MRKLLTPIIFSLLSASASFAQNNGTGFVGNGYYRIHNFATNRYIYVTDNKDYFDKLHDSEDFQAIQLWKDPNRAISDPASVIFDAVNSAKAKDIDILIVDTAGRLHNKKNLMEELRKMNKILDNHLPEYKRENLIVLDGTTGQNAMSQAREFGEVTDLTGIILTKMDGTSKGGIAVAIVSELNIPVKYIGVGESLDDLERFEPQEFVDALFDIDHEERVKLDHEIVARKLSSGELDSSQLTEEEAIDILTRH